MCTILSHSVLIAFKRSYQPQVCIYACYYKRVIMHNSGRIPTLFLSASCTYVCCKSIKTKTKRSNTVRDTQFTRDLT